jgi:uncharacterized protein (TIGR00730 family)
VGLGLKRRDAGSDGAPGAEAVDRLRARLRARAPDELDPEFLSRAERRAARLRLEYLEPELSFADRGVAHTIVVFGSTRMREGSRFYEIARELGRLVGLCGRGPGDHRLVVMTGAGPGGMEAANRGASEVGAASAGLNIRLTEHQEPNPYVTPELCFQFRYFALRKLHFMLRARALVALPGGYGTLDELFETLCLVQTGKRAPLPVVLVGESFWRRVIDFDFLRAEGMIDAEDLTLFEFAETAQEIWDRILGWYALRGTSIFSRDWNGEAETE